jgi:hypothetical protein
LPGSAFYLSKSSHRVGKIEKAFVFPAESDRGVELIRKLASFSLLTILKNGDIKMNDVYKSKAVEKLWNT